MAYIEVDDLAFAYDKDPVLMNITFSLDAGEFVILTGENGAAKSTLMRNILGLLKPTHGSVTIAKKNKEGKKLQIGYVPQFISSFNSGFPSTVYEFVKSGRYQQGRWFKRLTKRDKEHVEKALKSVGMWEHRNKRIGDLSGGQKQRIALARVFATDPDVFVLDEPTTGMDRDSRDEFLGLLEHAAYEHHKAILMVTHEDEIISGEHFTREIHLVRKEGVPWRCFSMTS